MMLLNIQLISQCAIQSEWAHSLIIEECEINVFLHFKLNPDFFFSWKLKWSDKCLFDRGNASESCWRDIRQGFRHQGGTGERGHDWARKLLVAAERCWSRHPLGTNSGIYEHHHILKRRIGRWETVKILLRSFIIFANIANFTFQPKIGAYLWNGIWTKWKVVSELCETLLVYH